MSNALKATKLVLEFFGRDERKTWLWFRTPNPMLGGVSANEMIESGRSNKLLKFVENAKEENGWTATKKN